MLNILGKLEKIENSKTNLKEKLQGNVTDIAILKDLKRLTFVEQDIYQKEIVKYFVKHLVEVCESLEAGKYDVYVDGEFYCELKSEYQPGVGLIEPFVNGDIKLIACIYKNTKRIKNDEMIEYKAIATYSFEGIL